MIRTIFKIIFTILAIITEGVIGYQMLFLPFWRFFTNDGPILSQFVDALFLSLCGIVLMSLFGSLFFGIIVFISYMSF